MSSFTLVALMLGGLSGAGGVSAAERRVVFHEVDTGYPGDAPNDVGSAQDAPVLEPGVYGTTLVSESETEAVYQGPSFSTPRDADVYKITVLPGVLAKFTVTPNTGQDMFVRLFDADGREVADHHYNAGNLRAAGFAETVLFLKGLHLSREEDGEATVYILVKLNGGNKAGRYSIDYEESNANDATWTTDAADSLLRAPRVGWGQRYEGYLGYGDKVDCFQLDAASAIGQKVTIRVKPLDPDLNTDLNPGWSGSSYFNASGEALGLLETFPVRIGSREYGRDDIVKARINGGVGFPDEQVIYPYYAASGTSGSDVAYVCVKLAHIRGGAGRYELTLMNEDGLSTAPITDADKASITPPPGAPVAPEPPSIRMKKTASIVASLPTSAGGSGGASTAGSSDLKKYRIGDELPDQLRNAAKEKRAMATFKKIYRRAADLERRADQAAVDAIAYELQPKRKDAKAEKNATNKFRAIFKRVPRGAADLAILRAMAYAGVKR